MGRKAGLGMMIDLAKRFRGRIRILDNGCHEWLGYVMKSGYGQVGYMGKVIYTHRAAWLAFRGDPGDAYVLHRCDNRRCVNPDHLFLGSFQDNMDDMVAKKRHAYGERNGHAKLTENDARAIMASEESLVALAKRYGISPVSVWQVRHGKTWTHLREDIACPARRRVAA